MLACVFANKMMKNHKRKQNATTNFIYHIVRCLSKQHFRNNRTFSKWLQRQQCWPSTCKCHNIIITIFFFVAEPIAPTLHLLSPCLCKLSNKWQETRFSIPNVLYSYQLIFVCRFFRCLQTKAIHRAHAIDVLSR